MSDKKKNLLFAVSLAFLLFILRDEVYVLFNIDNLLSKVRHNKKKTTTAQSANQQPLCATTMATRKKFCKKKNPDEVIDFYISNSVKHCATHLWHRLLSISMPWNGPRCSEIVLTEPLPVTKLRDNKSKECFFSKSNRKLKY